MLDASGSIELVQRGGGRPGRGRGVADRPDEHQLDRRVTQFASLSELLAARTQIDDTSMADGGALAEALQRYYTPIPPRPANVNIYLYSGAEPHSRAAASRPANSSNQYTNWDQGLARPHRRRRADGVRDRRRPHGYDLDKPGDPFDPAPADVAVNTNQGQANQLTMDRAVEEANAIKAGETRMLRSASAAP